MKHKVAKILNVLFVVVVFYSFFITAYCEQPLKTYSVEEVPLQITLPEKLITFSRNIDENDPNLNTLGLDKSTLEKKYIDSNIYLNAISLNKVFEITIKIEKTPYTEKIYDLNRLSSSKVKLIRDALLTENDYYESCEVYDQRYTKFLRSVFYRPENHLLTAYLDYYTIINGQAVNITFHSCNDIITKEQSDFFESVVSNVRFTDIKAKPSAFKKIGVWVFLSFMLIFLGVAIFISFRGLSGYFKKRSASKRNIIDQIGYEDDSIFKPIYPPSYDKAEPYHNNDRRERINVSPDKRGREIIKKPDKPVNTGEGLKSFLGIEIHYYN